MPEVQAERRIVKSPPELWAELSELESLARHLEEFGQIRITRLDPETTVAWEGDEVSGTVELEASGWGTKVRLTVATPEEETPPAETGAEGETGDEGVSEERFEEIEIVAIPTALAIEPLHEPAPVPDPATAAARTAGASVPPPGAIGPALPPRARQGWLGRLLRRRRVVAAEPVAAEPPETGGAIEDEVPEIVADHLVERRAETDDDGIGEDDHTRTGARLPSDPGARSEDDGIDERDAAPAATGLPIDDGSPAATERPIDDGSPVAAERAERVEWVLATVLDDLGAAHHRPFSRG